MKKNLLMMKNVSSLNECERFDIIHSVEMNLEALNYLEKKFQNLSIEICGDYTGNIIELMNSGLLEGWCWETTESAIVFLEDDDYIERGNLKLNQYEEYWHSWICFKFNNKMFVFDPCLQILVDRSIYHHIFEVSIAGSSTAKEVREDLIFQINNPKEKSYEIPEEAMRCLNNFFAKCGSRQKNETQILGNDDVNSPMYRNNTGYKATIENGKITTLIAHYYLKG